MAKEFAMQLLRLKQELSETEDQAVADALGLSKAAFSDRKRRGAFPADRVFRLAAENLKIDVNYVLTGTRASDVPGAMGTKARYDGAGPWANNTVKSAGEPATSWLREPLRATIASIPSGTEAIKRALESLTHAAARHAAETATRVTHVPQQVARSVQPLDEPLLRSVMLGVEDFIRLQDLSPPADEKVALIVKVYAIFRERKQSKASRANVVEFLRAA